jgi:hypothetical protein
VVRCGVFVKLVITCPILSSSTTVIHVDLVSYIPMMAIPITALLAP